MTVNAKESVNQKFRGKARVRVGGILIEDDEILLLKHEGVGQKEFLWSPPGGGLEFGEDAVENLKREFLEETGLHICVHEMLFVNEFISDQIHAIELFFRVKKTGGILKLGSDPEMGQQQILTEFAFFDEKKILNTEKEYLHNMFIGINKPQEVLNLTGYFKFVNNSIK
ncbi:8-oxo-dGTP diphosphatase [Marivirga sericea]|uniref:8-oxo-dGTP diphosphatase n=1 Tax=Marivirga sericea TaxID=1028 RepID=A0A1X7K9D6_9BACT|nr:NUDIX hydrolase [Marivirga sericea]SMG37374.1 8-oxo-dGTP diphosphatase [Marivirga sericea]